MLTAGRLLLPRAEEVFGDLLPLCIAASKSDIPLRAMGQIIVANPERRGVLLAYLAVLVAKHRRDRRVAMKLIALAQGNLIDNYNGLLYASMCGIGVFLLTVPETASDPGIV